MLGHRASKSRATVSLFVLVAAFPAALVVDTATAAPIGHGYVVTTYDSLPDPMALSFGTDGSLYVGRDNSGSGGGNADTVRIHRIAPGGGSHIQYGAAPTADPDAVIFDATGAYSGVAGSVIVGGRPAASASGVISAIRPNQSVVTLAGPSAGFVNPSDFAIDNAGRMLFTDFEGTGAVQQLSGGTNSPFFSPGTSYRDISVHPTTGDVYLRNTTANTIRKYSSTGTFIATVVSGITGSAMAIGTGSSTWGTTLYVGNGTRILRLNSASSRDTIASNFVSISNIEFGPGDALYVSDFGADKVYRIQLSTAAVEPVSRASAVRLAIAGAQPSSGATRLRLTVPRTSEVSVRVFDVNGREVATLWDGVASAGEHEVSWSGRDAGGRASAPGVYLARAISTDGVATTRIVRIR